MDSLPLSGRPYAPVEMKGPIADVAQAVRLCTIRRRYDIRTGEPPAPHRPGRHVFYVRLHVAAQGILLDAPKDKTKTGR
jgi:hypothetical protein